MTSQPPVPGYTTPPTTDTAKPSTRPSVGALIGVGVFGVLVGAALVAGTGWMAFSGWDAIQSIFSSAPVESSSSSSSGVPLTTGSVDTVAVASKALPSVASIVAQVETNGGFFGAPVTAESSGSGVVISADGYIVTNYHVIAGQTSIQVAVGGDTYDATVVGTDESSDLAVLKVNATGLTPIEIGSSDALQVGEFVMAVGSPFGLGQSVSTGIVSGLGRTTYMENQSTVSAYIDLIQTDAAINPGNSGGALVNSAGQLVGINTLIESTSGSSAGVGFAIPVETAMDIASQLMDDGTASHPYLGVASQTVTAQIAQVYSLGVDAGAYVITVAEGSPAERAGIQVGDIITAIGGREVAGREDVLTAVRSHKVGDAVTVEIFRNGERVSVTATLADDSAR